MKILSRLIPFFALFFVVSAMGAESSSDFPWKAHWIGPSSSSTDLSGANWIWADEPGVDPVQNAPVGEREFTKSISIPQGRRVVNAAAVFTADNHFQLSVNGKLLGSGDDWQHPTTSTSPQPCGPEPIR